MILKNSEIIVNARVDSMNELRKNKLKVDGRFTDDENGVEYLSVSTEGNNFMYGLIQILCEASGLRFYGTEYRDGKLRLMLF